MPSQLCLPGIAAPPPETDRLFFALLPDPAAAQEIHHLASEVRQAHDLKCRLTPMHRLHLSLQHLGDHAGFPTSWANAARRAAGDVRFPAFDLQLDRVLTFSGRARERRPLPCVMTATSDHSVLRFHRELVSAMRARGIAVQSRAFTPHVTMFYDPRIVEEREVTPIRFSVREFVMVHSRKGSGMPYELPGIWPLAAR
jgi:RNA 2',3'-cyclic 3'-phosphodiesterase